MAQATAPILDSTICDIVLCLLEFRLRRLSGRVATAARGPGLTPTRHSPIERHRSTKSRELKIERSQPRPIGNLHSLIITKNGFQRLYNAVRPPAM